VIRRLLIANRGEIAVRIIRACREMGIAAIAVYSEADADAPHVSAADQAVCIGPPPAKDSYLNVERLIEAARSTQADAVHPGYGFLSERAHFVRACETAGLIFVGPSASSLERMGSKVGARTLMAEAGVPVVPGETSADQSDAALVAAAGRVGFPLLVKPASGGGGIGMKTVRSHAGLPAALEAARREAKAAFGDATLYLERLVERPRHVEIQIMADAHGNIVHLFERECSLQRRHQKTIEESPCPVLSPAMRTRMGAAAVTVARTVNYRNAGTVEFLLDGDGDDARFYFLEMNTRLQVEHPITECVVGVDLVRTQLLVASGEALPFSQESLSQHGHAIECRIYAEDPSRGFIPQAGPLVVYREPKGPGIRVDSGVRQGSNVSVYYDPLLAKLIVSAETREMARRRAIAALGEYAIEGIGTNIPFLIALLQHPAFVDAKVDTEFIDREGERLTHPALGTPALGSSLDPFDQLKGWRLDTAAGATTPRSAATSRPDAAGTRPRGRSDTDVVAPMPATVTAVNVAPGQTVKAGDVLIVLEAMKMELPLRSPRDGVIKSVRCKKGELVQPGVALLEYE
jgi:acetyl-CoA carboxylase biotin carboxylase subunit